MMAAKLKESLDEEQHVAKPWFKAVGGKRRLVPEIMKLVPKNYGTYYEPFVGGGALFFALKPKKAVLCDTNRPLINTWTVLQNSSKTEQLITQLKKLKYDKKLYLKIRENNFEAGDDVQKAAEFIYCNRTGFNGLFRVNQSGQFNVPFGKYTNPTICDEDNLRAVHRYLTECKAEIHHEDFTMLNTLKNAPKKGDLLYADPPYAPISKTSNFVGFGKHGFNDEHQRKLADMALWLKNHGVHVILSNSDCELIRKLYPKKHWKLKEIEAARAINSVGDGRGKITELLIY